MLTNISSAEYYEGSRQIIEDINLCLYSLIISVGVIWNGTLLLMFIRHKELRTTANTMILNLAVCDVMNLSVSAPLLYMFHYPHSTPHNEIFCRLHTVIRHVIMCASALSLVALSIQRFCITVPHLMFQLTCKTFTLTTLYVLLVWALSLLAALPVGVGWEKYGFLCGLYPFRYATSVLILVYSAIYCVLLPGIMFFFSIVTAKRIKSSIRNIPGEFHNRTQELVRKRSANVVTALALLFVVSYYPFWIWCIVAYWSHLDRRSTAMLGSEYLSKLMLFCNSCFNPVALYLASGTFRGLFRRYLCCSKQNKREILNAECTSSSYVQRQSSNV